MGFAAQQQSVPGVQAQMDPIPDCGENSYQGSGRLLGKKAIITGGDSGIGRAVAIAFAREGADVLIAYLNEDDDARDAATGRALERDDAWRVSEPFIRHCRTLSELITDAHRASHANEPSEVS